VHLFKEHTHILGDFSNKVQTRLLRYNQSPGLITEDCIRYDFFSTLLQLFNTDDIILEYPHDILAKKEIDLVIDTPLNKSIFEFKFNRRIPSRTEDTTGKFAHMYSDIVKLHSSQIAEDKFFIFLTDNQMRDYIIQNGYGFMLNKKFFDLLATQAHMDGKHFNNEVERKVGKVNFKSPIKMQKLFNKTYNNSHHLFVYRIG
jgi:hypothetical protein